METRLWVEWATFHALHSCERGGHTLRILFAASVSLQTILADHFAASCASVLWQVTDIDVATSTIDLASDIGPLEFK